MHPKRPGHYLRYYRQREPLHFQGAQPLRPLLPLLNGDIWCNLLEILCRDLYGMLDTNVHHKIAISRLSLVCRDWACRFRPILFQRVVLYSRNDLHTVADFVKSPHSRLLDHITFLDFHPMFGLLDIPWLHLIPLELRVKVHQLCLVNPLQSSPTPSLTSVFVLLPKAPPTSFAPFTHLCLCKHVFRSFLELRRLLSSLPNLQELGLRDVNWREGWYLPKAEPYLRRPVGLKCFRTSDLHQAWGLLPLSPLEPIIESYVTLSNTTACVLTAADYEYLEELLRSAVNCVFIAGGCNAGSASVSTEPDRNAAGYLFNNICIRSESSLDCIKCSLSRPVASTLARPDNIHLQLHLRADSRGSGHHYRALIRHTLPSLAPILLSCCQQLKISLVGHLLFRTSFTRVENDIRRCFDICLQRPVGAEEHLEYPAPSLDVDLTGLVIQLIVPSSTRYFFYDNVDSDSPVREEETSYEDGPHFIQFDQADHRAVYLHEVLRGGATLVHNEEPTKDEMLTAAWTGSPRFQIEWPGHRIWVPPMYEAQSGLDQPGSKLWKYDWAKAVAIQVKRFYSTKSHNYSHDINDSREATRWDLRKITFEQLMLLKTRCLVKHRESDITTWRVTLALAISWPQRKFIDCLDIGTGRGVVAGACAIGVDVTDWTI